MKRTGKLNSEVYKPGNIPCSKSKNINDELYSFPLKIDARKALNDEVRKTIPKN